MRRINIQDDFFLGNGLVGACLTVSFGHNLITNLMKVIKFFVPCMEKSCPFSVICMMKSKNQRSPSDNSGTSRQEIPNVKACCMSVVPDHIFV
jgi:hypothetical protein